MINPLTIRAQAISRLKKERYLVSLSEDEFRDQVIRPLFLRQGLQDGRELCGPTEEGKDTLFVSIDHLGMDNVYVQTKKGSMNLAGKASQNTTVAATQLKTALETRVVLKKTKVKTVPTKAILCASGRINQRAKDYIFEQIQDPRLVFMDADDLVPAVDEHLPELWFGIDAEISPYLRKIRRSLEELTEESLVGVGGVGKHAPSAATDQMFVQLTVHRTLLRPVKVRGRVEQKPKFEELPIRGLLSKRERLILVLGDAGSGKSTCLRRLAYILAAKGLESGAGVRIPVLLRATELAGAATGASLVQMCADETKRVSGGSSASFGIADLQNGRVVVFIDALDELADDAARRRVGGLAVEFSRAYPQCQLIATSRGHSFVGDLEELRSFSTFRLSPISYKQAEQILQKVQSSQSLPVERSREVLRRLQQVHGMELNPLLVTVFAATSEYSRRDIPANITELFKKFTEMMLGRWDAAKGLAQQYHAPLKDFILTKIGFEMHRRMTTVVSKEEFRGIVDRELSARGHSADVSELLEEMLYRSGLFRVIGGSVEFRHLLLQEFFAGRGIPSAELLEGIIAEDWWQRAVVFYFGEHPGDSRGLDAMRRTLAERPVKDVFTAAMTLGLAMQACYLIEVKDKVDVICAVVDGLTAGKDEMIRAIGRGDEYPLTGFLGYYLFGRDAVASGVIAQRLEEIRSRCVEEVGEDGDEKDLRMFWLITGLIESGSLDEAERLVKGFRPRDPRLLLAVHLGCFMIQHLRVSTADEKRMAERITRNVAEHVGVLLPQVLSEVKGELLEIRGGKVAAIDVSSEQERRG